MPTVTELKAELRRLGKPTSGRKSVLAERLAAARGDNGAATAAASASDAPPLKRQKTAAKKKKPWQPTAADCANEVFDKLAAKSEDYDEDLMQAEGLIQASYTRGTDADATAALAELRRAPC